MMFFSSKINYEIRTDARGVAKGGDGVARAPRNLADQLTLLKPRGGGQIMPVTLLPAPLDSKCYLHLCTLHPLIRDKIGQITSDLVKFSTEFTVH